MERFGLLLFAVLTFSYFTCGTPIEDVRLGLHICICVYMLHAIHVRVMLHLLLIVVDSTGAGAFLYSEQDILVSFVSNKTMAKIEFKN